MPTTGGGSTEELEHSMTLPLFPPQVIGYIRRVFARENRRASEKILRVPNCSEPPLDLTLVEHLT